VRVPRAFLEVTATNDPAVRMYRSVGFRAYKTLYRAVELPRPDTVVVGL
jgi:ribosomal protein S18 acetylase RimI-like enzyme